MPFAFGTSNVAMPSGASPCSERLGSVAVKMSPDARAF
jgi:hypothetical protein